MSSPKYQAPFLPPAFVLPDDPKLRQQYVEKRENDTALYLNQREIGSYYISGEIINGQQWLTAAAGKTVQAFRKVINFGALPNATTKSVAHGVTFNSSSVMTRMYATATHPAPAPPTAYNPAQQLFIPIPYASPTLNQCIALNADGTNINITTAIDYSTYTVCYVVIEYLKG